MNQRGEYGSCKTSRLGQRGVYGTPHVGISLFHTVGDRERAVEQLSTGFAQLSSEVMGAAGWRAAPYREAAGPLWDWWRIVGVPVLDEWQRFQADQMGSWVSRWATSWETYENWGERLKKLRTQAELKLRTLGKGLETVPVSDLPKTLPGTVLEAGGKVIEKTGEVVWDTGKILKWTAIGTLSLVGVVAVASLVTTLKRGQAPLDLVRHPLLRLGAG